MLRSLVGRTVAVTVASWLRPSVSRSVGSRGVGPRALSNTAAAMAAADAADTPARRVRVYTRTGDQGTSSLFTGERRSKEDVVFEALGTTDELNSAIGLAREYCLDEQNGIAPTLEEIQCVLFDVGANLATPRSSANEARLARTEFDPDGALAAALEHSIDAMDDELPPLRQFILPSGGKASASLHCARSICRRAERRAVPLVQQGDATASVGVYLNRLSDYLFVAARYAAFKAGRPEITYQKRQGRRENKAPA